MKDQEFLREFEEACRKKRDEYIDMGIDNLDNVYYELASFVERTRRAVRDFIENDRKFSVDAFEK